MIPSGDVLTVTLSFPTTEDFDIYILDSTMSFTYAYSWYSNP